MKLLWLLGFLIFAFLAVLTYDRKATQVVQQPVSQPSPVQAAKPAEHEYHITQEERKRLRETNPYFHKEIQDDPPAEPEAEPQAEEVPQRYKDMGLARFSGTLARDRMKKKEQK